MRMNTFDKNQFGFAKKMLEIKKKFGNGPMLGQQKPEISIIKFTKIRQ